LHYLGEVPVISNDPATVAGADMLLLPGVGSFRRAMLAMQKRGLDQAIIEAVQAKSRKILGICLGMQLMGAGSTEDGYTEGLNLIPRGSERFTSEELGDKKNPHVGFDLVESDSDSQLFSGLKRDSDFYFVHSYRMLPGDLSGKAAICNYGIDFLAAYEHQNIFATQFHPEKSQSNGLILLKNFLKQ
jgi:glutamine amidotransferase